MKNILFLFFFLELSASTENYIACDPWLYNEGLQCSTFEELDLLKGKTEAKEGSAPWMVYLQDYRYDPPHSFCGGTIIDLGWVLTSAFCVQAYDPKNIRIVAGDHNTSSIEGWEQLVHVKEVLLHENFGSFSHDNDVALLQVWPLLMPSQRVKSFRPKRNATGSKHIGELCVTYGWEMLEDSRLSSPVLLESEVTILSNLECRTRYSDGLVSRKMVCADRHISVSCLWFWGSPLVCGNSDRDLVGILSWSNGCEKDKYPIVFVDVSGYVDWIEEHIGRY